MSEKKISDRKWTNEQLQAIKLNGANILVSAAAGSGKTSVLVERIVNKIINENVDIDKILVVTFTNAAASEMRQRLMDEIYKKLDENPNDENLQRQILLINKANISTIHSFCLNVIRNNFFEIGMSSNFRVADETEIEIMKQEIIEDIFEEEYENQNKDFLKLLEMYTTYKDDTYLKDLILKIYEFIQSDPFPTKWLENAVEEYKFENTNIDFADTKWGKIILDKVNDILQDCITTLNSLNNELKLYPNLAECASIVSTDLLELKNINIDNWDSAYIGINNKAWNPWSRKSKFSEEEKEVKDRAKDIRNSVKNNFSKAQEMVRCSSNDAVQDIKKMYETLKNIENLVLIFKNEFSKRKKEKNIVDFHDIEHLALKILIDENGNPTEIAKKYDFDEIEIDEYQDSNSVQEYILQSVSNGHNIFMVGDVKQSIYKFRQANPKLFMQKYNEYKLPEEEIKDDTKILLYKNFRSRKNILDITNLVFTNIMSQKMGEIEYTKEEALNQGREFEDIEIDCETELNIIETESDEDDEELQEVIENAALEARLVAKRIKELQKQNVKFKDIAILLRSPKSVASIYEKELTNEGSPVFSDITTEYLHTIEIDTMISLLKIIDNPLQDIPLVTVLRSEIGGFTDNDLLEIRLVDKNSAFFRALEKANSSELLNDNLKQKVSNFLQLIDNLKSKEKELSLDEFIWYIYSETGYYHYVGLMPDGNLRQANLKKLFEKAKEYEKISFKGLFNFIIFMEKVGTSNNDLAAARVIGENDDVVRIMSIHKSKGLEFPIVFLCGTSKGFNLRDMSEKIILDNQIGIGVNYLSDGIEFPTLTKDAIKIKSRKEAVSEEMRILYVALTRAKDKLIVTGTSKNVQKELDDKINEINKYYKFIKPEKLNENIVEKYRSYLDWLELVYVYNENPLMKLNVINKNELIKNKEENENNQNLRKNQIVQELDGYQINKEKYKKIDELLNFEYEYLGDVELPTKTSVTAIKQEKEVSKKIPKFAQDEKITGARKGTIIHLILSKLTNQRDMAEIEKLIESLREKEIITKEEQNSINMKIIENYLNSELYRELQEAKEVNRETPFYLNIDSNEIYENTDEKILVQGIIDLYYIDKENNLVLVDYKTDYVSSNDEKELIDKYKTQLELYKRALEKALNKKVMHTYIYSTYFNKNIECK